MQEINFDCDIRPAGGEPIRLSTASGEILVINNEITLIFLTRKANRRCGRKQSGICNKPTCEA